MAELRLRSVQLPKPKLPGRSALSGRVGLSEVENMRCMPHRPFRRLQAQWACRSQSDRYLASIMGAEPRQLPTPHWDLTGAIAPRLPCPLPPGRCQFIGSDACKLSRRLSGADRGYFHPVRYPTAWVRSESSDGAQTEPLEGRRCGTAHRWSAQRADAPVYAL